jgi:hypothetical protein
MFATVYLHYTPVIFEKMLARYFEEARSEFHLPADIERYTQLDDMDLILALRKSKNPWARRIVERRPFVLLDEHNEGHQQARVSVSHDELVRRLKDARIDHIATRSRSVLSKYFDDKKKAPIYVVTGSHDPVPLEEYTPLYARYAKPALLLRVFVDPNKRAEARAILQHLIDENRERPRVNVTLPPQDA